MAYEEPWGPLGYEKLHESNKILLNRFILNVKDIMGEIYEDCDL